MKENTPIAALLRERKLKATAKRIEVLSLITAYKKPMPFSQIQRNLQNFDRVTLYRTIHALMENGIIHKALMVENETYYAVCSSSCSTDNHQHKHIHFKCSECFEVSCVQTTAPITISVPGHLTNHFEVEASGLCASCNI